MASKVAFEAGGSSHAANPYGGDVFVEERLRSAGDGRQAGQAEEDGCDHAPRLPLAHGGEDLRSARRPRAGRLPPACSGPRPAARPRVRLALVPPVWVRVAMRVS